MHEHYTIQFLIINVQNRKLPTAPLNASPETLDGRTIMHYNTTTNNRI